MGRDIITVDGWAASGKSAIAKALSKTLGYGHLNSGLLYRAVGHLVLSEEKDPTSCSQVLEVMSKHSLDLSKDGSGSSSVVLDGGARDAELATPEVSLAASLVARHQPVRDQLLPLQRNAFGTSGVVAEGRDMGTVVFPEARIKFFITADVVVRAARRVQQLGSSPDAPSLESVRRSIEERDERDATSPVGTTKQADGAIMIDNSERSLQETIQVMLQTIQAGQGISATTR
jgi:cytidylate kinase